jgi:hypothetical protein
MKYGSEISCASAIIIIQKSLIFTTFSMLSEALYEEQKKRREYDKSIMKSGTCFRLMELIKNVKYVLRVDLLKSIVDELSII